ncbi:hypothetical protein TPHA_0K02050 [Tetrapisispora phaffii CBS 4417]|uniref:GIT Spa2 homology (SHD) domain-containing protein n=1 Tax=Tetrapisispora phaffii (strain ATCC 24235 / CBS 4417 / NBRC 1672 / NRRL Y-8282 / UCD 70-5) TaxID=1071381 RepID=G8BZL0_TETPH|nr:hypothetical protein TPHA_0K02050 [Tetrapisispora phaffii CBS 4417]CCE65338.1 hypothetical protein TPHA_0K02050 [Tetrapisispora phaffii CBS 4417]
MREPIDNERMKSDMLKYHDEFATFIAVTGVNTDRSQSSRAHKARGKLFKLSDSQFYELSTDVYDELQRRLDEAHGQPEHLLPKASFHVKRNQAREKLSNLTQPRFCDLATDILFEVKRRGYDSNTMEAEHEKGKEEEKIDKSRPETQPTSPIPPSGTIQTSHVIARKASLTWSSDGEEDKKEDKQNLKRDSNEHEAVPFETRGSVQKTVLPYSEIYNPTLRTPNVTSSIFDGNDVVKPPNQMGETNGTTSSPGYSIFSPVDKYYAFDNTDHTTESPVLSQGLVPNMTVTTEENHETPFVDVVTEKTPIKADLETAFKEIGSEGSIAAEGIKLNDSMATEENDTNSVPNESKYVDTVSNENNDDNIVPDEKKDINIVVDENTDRNIKQFSDLNAQISELTIENEQLKQRIAELQLSEKQAQLLPNSFKDTFSSETQSNNFDFLQENSLVKFVVDDGNVPYHLVVHLHCFISEFYKALNQNDEEDTDNKLFELLLKISNCSKEIMDFVPITEYRDEITVLKVCISHLISTVRYYLIYGNLLPKITVQASISELAISFCRLISSAKIRRLDDVSTPVDAVFNIDDKSTLNSPNDSVKSGTRSTLTAIPSHLTLETKEISPVKPLKITQKVNRNIANTPPSVRKPNSTSLFSSMMDTKSTKPTTAEVISNSDIVAEENIAKPTKTGLGILNINKVQDSDENIGETEHMTKTKDDEEDELNETVKETEAFDNRALIAQSVPEITVNSTSSKEDSELDKSSNLVDPSINDLDSMREVKEDKTDNEDNLGTNEEIENSEIYFEADAFDVENPDNTLSDLLFYVEHQTVSVISSIQSLLQSIKEPNVTKGSLRKDAVSINSVITLIMSATSAGMEQKRNFKLREHCGWIIQSLEDCITRITTLCELVSEASSASSFKENDLADKQYKQRLAGIAFDIAKCTKELVKSIEQANLDEN